MLQDHIGVENDSHMSKVLIKIGTRIGNKGIQRTRAIVVRKCDVKSEGEESAERTFGSFRQQCCHFCSGLRH